MGQTQTDSYIIACQCCSCRSGPKKEALKHAPRFSQHTVPVAWIGLLQRPTRCRSCTKASFLGWMWAEIATALILSVATGVAVGILALVWTMQSFDTGAVLRFLRKFRICLCDGVMVGGSFCFCLFFSLSLSLFLVSFIQYGNVWKTTRVPPVCSQNALTSHASQDPVEAWCTGCPQGTEVALAAGAFAKAVGWPSHFRASLPCTYT